MPKVERTCGDACVCQRFVTQIAIVDMTFAPSAAMKVEPILGMPGRFLYLIYYIDCYVIFMEKRTLIMFETSQMLMIR